jgi:predicted transglutaminase-like protease
MFYIAASSPPSLQLIVPNILTQKSHNFIGISGNVVWYKELQSKICRHTSGLRISINDNMVLIYVQVVSRQYSGNVLSPPHQLQLMNWTFTDEWCTSGFEIANMYDKSVELTHPYGDKSGLLIMVSSTWCILFILRTVVGLMSSIRSKTCLIYRRIQNIHC